MGKRGEFLLGLFSAVFAVLLFLFATWKFLGVVSAANDNVKAAAITAIVTVLTFVLGKYFEQSRDRRAKVNEEKIRIYEKFFAAYFHMFTSEDFRDDAKPPDWAIKEMIGIQKELVMWGSDAVLKEYLNFKKAVTSFATRGRADDSAIDVDGLATVIRAVAELLKAMRRDIGYKFTTFSGEQLAALQMNVGEKEFPALLQAIRKA